MPIPPDPHVRRRIRVSGLVQGVGFRPFVWREATARELTGWVGNDLAGVFLEVQGPAEAVEDLLTALRSPPPLARIDDVWAEPIEPLACSPEFTVVASNAGGVPTALVTPDTATCTRCLGEVADPADRRHGYAFVTCTDCGPRFTLVESLPYDRARTTMAPFALCTACAAEYGDPADRRFHAEPLCCPQCGPQLELRGGDGRAVGGPALQGAADRLRAGAVVAVKGLGGYHLAVDATDEAAVLRLRERKRRPHRPFAVLLRDLADVERFCVTEPLHRELLTGPARPVVVVPRRPGAPVASSVAPDGGPLGVLLPYTALHSLLAAACDRPLVLTSANAAGEPLVVDDDEALTRLVGIADAFLVHDRRIAARADDSVVAVAAGRPVPLRRSRGYVPLPVTLPVASPVPVLACGPAQKATICVVRGSAAFLSAHLGDLGQWRSQQAYEQAIRHLEALVGVEPQVLAHDLHPDYPSTRYAQDRPAVRRIGVQHHHAHIASCLAENGSAQKVLGVAFDGLGLGPDGQAWGGEFLVADLLGYQRVVHLAPVGMPGADAAVREPWRMALSQLDAAYGDALPAGLDLPQRQQERWKAVRSIARSETNSPTTTSAGRLFDAVSALLGVCDVVSYDGQAAVELEILAASAGAPRDELLGYPFSLPEPRVISDIDAPLAIDMAPLFRALVTDLLAGTSPAVLAARFHESVAQLVAQVCRRLRPVHDLSTVALSGGVFCNALLLARTVQLLEADGFTVLTHRIVPANDGGLALGQAAVAAAVLAAEQGAG